MIRSIRHRGLKRLYEDDDPRGVIRSTRRNCDTFGHGLMPPARLGIWICQGSGYIRSRASWKVFGR